MTADVDGKKVKPLKVNYMMTGVPVNKDSSEITIKYKPQYWYTMIALSVISIFLSVVWCIHINKKTQRNLN